MDRPQVFFAPIAFLPCGGVEAFDPPLPLLGHSLSTEFEGVSACKNWLLLFSVYGR
jgi:hypothetical protein